MTKVIFLDIDGVIITSRSLMASGLEDQFNYPNCERDMDQWAINAVDPVSVRLLNAVTDRTGAKIVVSSTHRKHFWAGGCCDFEAIKTYIKRMGVTGEVIGVTPIIRGIRGYEIDAWLSAHADVSQYAILDDDRDMLNQQMERLVNTDYSHGIQIQDFDSLMSKLS